MSTGPSPPADDALALARAFVGFGPAYGKWLHSIFAANGLSFARMKLLGALHGGKKIMNKLSEEVGVTARNVTALVDALEEKQLVRRVPHETDRRATYIELTSAGAEYARQMAAGAPLEAMAELFHGLTPDERKQLLDLVAKLQGLLAARGFGGGPCVSGDPAAD